MKILMLTPYLPYPLLSGGQIRTYNLLKNLKDDCEITLFSLIKDDAEKKNVPHLKKFCTKVEVFKRSKDPFTLRNIVKAGFTSYPFVVTRNLVTETLEAVKEELSKNHYDLIHAETFYMMPNIPKTKVPIILVEQTIEYLGYQSYAKASKFWPIKPLLYMDIAKIKYWEQYYWQHCDRLITMSDNDRDYIRSRHDNLNQIDVVANGVDSEFFDALRKKLPESPTVLIVGTFKWLPNIEAVTYLVEQIWPLVLANMPTAKLHIVGYSPTEKILSYGKDASITVSGNLDDIRSAYATAHVLLAPVKSGKGTRYKILEAMATRTPIVATPLAVEGIAGVIDGKHALLAKGPMELAKHTVRVLQDPALQKKLADNSKRLVTSNYDWKAISANLNRVYQELGSTRESE